MEIGFRWYGTGNDQIKLTDIKQIPQVKNIVWALHSKNAGELWNQDEINTAVKEIKDAGFSPKVVESVNVSENIKLGKPERELDIKNYKETIKNLSKAGVEVITYNFMPVFDWTRTDLFKETEDGSNALFFEKKIIDTISPKELINKVKDGVGSFTMPGWEVEKLSKIESLLAEYSKINSQILWKNLEYFLKEIIPTAKEYNIKMAIHPDDPPWDIFNLPRLIINRDNIKRFLDLVPEMNNGLALCTGSLGANPKNNIPAMIREFKDRIHFAHIRNVKVFENGDFIETSHDSGSGSVDIDEVIKAYYEIGFKGVIRPDHGRHLWGEEKYCRPGYGLYDRALGIMYILGSWNANVNFNKKG